MVHVNKKVSGRTFVMDSTIIFDRVHLSSKVYAGTKRPLSKLSLFSVDYRITLALRNQVRRVRIVLVHRILSIFALQA